MRLLTPKQIRNHESAVIPAHIAESCPFCQSQPTITPWHGGRPSKRMIECGDDRCYVQPSVTGETQAQALRRWNDRRPIAPAK